MQSLSIRFRTVERLRSFIVENALYVHKYIFAQILLPKSKKSYFHDICTLLKDELKQIEIFGINSDDTLLNATVSQEIVINFLIFEDFKPELVYKKNIFECEEFDDSFYILYATDVDKTAVVSKITKDTSLVATFFNDFIIYKSDILTTGCVYLKIEKKFDLEIEFIDSIESIGRGLLLTKTDKRTIFKIDELTPKEFYSHYLSENISKNLKVASYTFALLKEKSDGYLSSLVLNDTDRSVEVGYDVNDGDSIRLGFANNPAFYENYEKVIDRFNNKSSDFFFLIASSARKNFLEKNGFEFDNAVGCFSKSELVVFNGEVKELSHSIIMININTHDKYRLKKKRYTSVKAKVENLLEIEALSNIAKVSSYELEELNKELEKKVKQEVEKNLRKDAILIHRSRLAQMGEMMSLIAHQWKQPLSAISATSSGLHIKIELDMYDKEFFLNSLTKIEEFVNHLSTTIDDFSNFFKPSKNKKEFYLYQAINKALSIATYSLSKNSIDVELDLDETLKINSYQNELIQVLLNLIKNAENILIKREIENPKIKIKLYKDENGRIIINVKDNGGGIEKKILNKIFEPYFSTKATKDSTGLGLYMSKFIIKESLSGDLEVKNEQDGASFSIILV